MSLLATNSSRGHRWVEFRSQFQAFSDIPFRGERQLSYQLPYCWGVSHNQFANSQRLEGTVEILSENGGGDGTRSPSKCSFRALLQTLDLATAVLQNVIGTIPRAGVLSPCRRLGVLWSL